MNKIILASGSPRRKQILQQIGIEPLCLPVGIDESVKNHEKPLNYCTRLALEKAQAGWLKSKQLLPVLGSDTIVVNEDKILGKPQDEKDAFRMLMSLSNKSHQVITAVAMVFKDRQKVVQSISVVEFTKLDEQEVKLYIASKDPMDKAGSYGIQGYASQWVKHITGSYSGIMGLPIFETSQLIKEFS